MTVHRFFTDQPLANASTIVITGDKVRHIRKVLRLSVGDEIAIFDGSGLESHAAIAAFGNGQLTCEIHQVSFPEREPKLNVTVGLGLIRTQRFEFAVQKLTEIGVQAIVPLIADRNVSKTFDEARWKKRRQRLEKIAIEASEQCERTVLPRIFEPEPVAKFACRHGCVALIERHDVQPIGSLDLGSTVSLAVGPEGGWSPEEQEMFTKAHVGEASLGRLVLRSETAAITAAAVLIQRSLATQQQYSCAG